METLKLLHPESNEQKTQEKPKDWKQPYIASFRKAIETSTKRPLKATWAQHKKQFENFVLKNWTDETTGEFELPTIEAWESELVWAVQDEWFMKTRGADIMYFLSKFSTFEKFEPSKRQPSDPILRHQCECGYAFTAKRSDLMKYQGKTLKCRECSKTYRVNDILNQSQSLTDYLP